MLKSWFNGPHKWGKVFIFQSRIIHFGLEHYFISDNIERQETIPELRKYLNSVQECSHCLVGFNSNKWLTKVN